MKNTDQITIAQSSLLAEFKKADNKTKEVLTRLFGPISVSKVTDRIKTIEDAYQALNNPVENIKTDDRLVVLSNVILALNNGVKEDGDECKNGYWYYPYFNNPAGSAVSLYDVVYYYEASDVPSRLCFLNESICLYAVEQFHDLYNELYKR